MTQFRTNKKGKKYPVSNASNKKKCPACGGHNTHRVIGGGYHCIPCGVDFGTPTRRTHGEPSDLERY